MADATFTDPQRTPHGTELRLWPLLVVGLVLVVGLGGAAVVYLRAKASRPPQAPSAEIGVWPSWMHQPPVYAPPTPTAPPPPPPTQAGVALPFPAPRAPGALPAPSYEAEGTGKRQVPGGATPIPPPPPTPGQRPTVRKWLFAEMQESKRKPFRTQRTRPSAAPAAPSPGDHAPAPTEREGADERAGKLITPASWEVPEDRTRVLYPSLAIYAELENDINSDVPGEVRLVVVQDVQDKYMQGHILLPQYTHIFASQDGVPSYAQAAITLKVRLAELPNGTMLDFTKSVAQDGRGQAGLRGTVDYHWVQVGAAAVLTALLSTGSQALVGNRGTFYPSFEEQAASNVARSIDRTGQAIVRRELDRPPTVTLKHGTLVMLQLKEAVSLQTDPVVVER